MEGQLGVKLLFDLDSWFLASKMTVSQTLAAMPDKLWERVKNDNPGNNTEMQSGGLVELLVSFRNPWKIRFELCASVGPLPVAILPLSQESEEQIVHQLLSELNRLHCLTLSEKPELKRGMCLPTREHGLSKLVFVGASHTGRMATLLGLGEQVLYLSLPTQTALKASVDNIAEKLSDMSLTKHDALILDIFSSSCLMGSDEMGMPVAPFQSEPGKYHIPGCLEIAPEGVLKKRFSAVRPILEIAGEAVKVCLLPIPRYVKSSCCGDEKHIINLHEDDFEDILMGAASSCHNVIAGEGEKAGLSLYTFDPVAAFGGGQKLAAKTSSAGLSVWQENHPVHLTSAAYKDIASLIQHQDGGLIASAPASGRRCINSIIPGQPQSSAPAVMSVPGWISGTEAGRADCGRGGRGQQWNVSDICHPYYSEYN